MEIRLSVHVCHLLEDFHALLPFLNFQDALADVGVQLLLWHTARERIQKHASKTLTGRPEDRRTDGSRALRKTIAGGSQVRAKSAIGRKKKRIAERSTSQSSGGLLWNADVDKVVLF